MKLLRVLCLCFLVCALVSCGETDTAEPGTTEGEKVPVETVDEPSVTEEIPTEIEPETVPAEVPAPEVSEPAPPPKAEPEVKVHPGLQDPSMATERAPERFRVRFNTTKGPFVVEIDRNWAPRGADRFYNLVKVGFFEDVAFFRVLENFVVQFGINGDPQVSQRWRSASIQDEPVEASNQRGSLTFAHGGPNTRTTQLFINLGDNVSLDQMEFPPIGTVVEGMSVVTSLYSGYGEGAPRGRGPSQGSLQGEGNKYLRNQFPELDYIKSASLLN